MRSCSRLTDRLAEVFAHQQGVLFGTMTGTISAVVSLHLDRRTLLPFVRTEH